MSHGFTWFSLIPGVKEHHIDHVVSSAFVAGLLILGGVLFYRRARDTDACLLPPRKISLSGVFGAINDFLIDMCRSIIGPGGERYLPIVGSIFYYILGCNLLGLIPGFSPPTSNVFTNFAVAFVVFVSTHFYGAKAHGIGYLKHFLAPVGGLLGIMLSFLFLPLELISHIFRPISLTVRLFGNMTGDHTVLEIFSNLVPIGVPVFFYLLGLMVCTLQAFIFAVLAIVYIAGAVEHH